MHILAACMAIIIVAQGEQPTTAPAPPPSTSRQIDPQQLPWAVRLGLRVHEVNQAFPLVDRVVLVPDEATYVDELSRWSPQGRWPVLIEDDQLAPMFIRRFQPQQVVRRAAVGPWPVDTAGRRALLEGAVVRSWGSDAVTKTIGEAFEAQRFVPAGVVITSACDPAWTAAFALAAGRGQPLLWMD
jgi:hypothetical protein